MIATAPAPDEVLPLGTRRWDIYLTLLEYAVSYQTLPSSIRSSFDAYAAIKRAKSEPAVQITWFMECFSRLIGEQFIHVNLDGSLRFKHLQITQTPITLPA